MDSIKKKMRSLAQATEEASSVANKFDTETKATIEIAEKYEEQIRTMQKKMQSMEGQFDTYTEQGLGSNAFEFARLFDVSLKLEDKEKLYTNAEGDVGSLGRRVVLLEEEVDRSERTLAKAVTDLARVSQRADAAVKMRQHLENMNTMNEENSDKLECQLKEDKFTLAESERKYDDIARKLHGKEEELVRAEERCTLCEQKIISLEEELKVVGQNLQQLEVSEEKALQREENYQSQLKNLNDSLKEAENREENATMDIQRLNIRVDQVEGDLLEEKMEIKNIRDDMDKIFSGMLSFAE